jgi:hypothetical protein
MRLLTIASIVTLALAPVGALAQAPATDSATAPTSETAAAENPDDTRIRCRRIPLTGSHVRVERVCKTVAEWRRLSDRGNDRVRDQTGQGRVCAGGACGNGN